MSELNQYSYVREGEWAPLQVVSGAAPYQRIRARVVYQQQGDHVHAFAKFRAPNGRVLMVHASTDLAEIERCLTEEARAMLLERSRSMPGSAASAGWFKKKFRKLKNKIKRIAKKSGVVKVLKTVHKVVNKAIDNPLVQAALASNPYGAAFLAARKATQVAFKAVKGSLKAKGKMRKLLQLAKGKNLKQALKAKNVLRFMKKTITGNPKLLKQAGKFAQLAKSSGDEMADLTAFVEGCVNPTPATVGAFYGIMGPVDIMGDDSDGTTDMELDALETFATSGAFEGLRWLAGRLSLHSMDANPDEMGTRDVLLLGRSAQAARFH